MPNTQPHGSQDLVSEDSSWSSASKLGGKVRELAHRSYRALKAPAPQESFNDIGDDYRDLRDQIARLHRKIHERRIGVLIPWIDALKRQVEDRFGSAGKAGQR
jgi:hypothetical protein